MAMSVSLKANGNDVANISTIVSNITDSKSSAELVSLTDRSPSNSAKPPRATLEQRLLVLDYYHRSKMSQAQIVEKFKDHISISGSTLSEWVKRESEFRARYSELQRKNLANAGVEKRKSRFKYQRMNELMDDYVQKMKIAGRPITEPILRDHWRRCAAQIGMKDRKRLESFSNGWLTHFKRRHNLSKNNSPKNIEDSASSKNSSVTNTPNNGEPMPLRKEASTNSMCDIFSYVSEPQYLVHTYEEKMDPQQVRFQTGGSLKNDDKPNTFSNSDILSSLQKNNEQSAVPNNGMAQRNIVSQELNSPEHHNASKRNGDEQQPDTQQPDLLNQITNTQHPMLPSQGEKIISQPSDRGSGINEIDFERFLSRYAFEFLSNNRDKYPSTFLLFENMRETFRRELAMHADERLRNIFM